MAVKTSAPARRSARWSTSCRGPNRTRDLDGPVLSYGCANHVQHEHLCLQLTLKTRTVAPPNKDIRPLHCTISPICLMNLLSTGYHAYLLAQAGLVAIRRLQHRNLICQQFSIYEVQYYISYSFMSKAGLQPCAHSPEYAQPCQQSPSTPLPSDERPQSRGTSKSRDRYSNQVSTHRQMPRKHQQRYTSCAQYTLMYSENARNIV